VRTGAPSKETSSHPDSARRACDDRRAERARAVRASASSAARSSCRAVNAGAGTVPDEAPRASPRTVERVAHANARSSARPPGPGQPVGDRARSDALRRAGRALVVRPLDGDDRGGRVLAHGRAARALPLSIVEKQDTLRAIIPPLRRHANRDLVRFGALADDGVGAHELDAAGPQLR
jgi:hypothetical protein